MTEDPYGKVCAFLIGGYIVVVIFSIYTGTSKSFFLFLVASCTFIPAIVITGMNSDIYKDFKHEADKRDAERQAELDKIRTPRNIDPDARF